MSKKEPTREQMIDFIVKHSPQTLHQDVFIDILQHTSDHKLSKRYYLCRQFMNFFSGE